MLKYAAYVDENGRRRKGYVTLSTKISRLQELGVMPLQIDSARIDDGTGCKNTFMINRAKWHEYCYKMFDNRDVQKAEWKYKKPKLTTPFKKHLRLSSPRQQPLSR